jgi:hypothetical protein
MKAYVPISTKLTLQCLPPDNILDESGLQSHVLATGSPGKGRMKLSVAEDLLLEATKCRPFVRSGPGYPGTYLLSSRKQVEQEIGYV